MLSLVCMQVVVRVRPRLEATGEGEERVRKVDEQCVEVDVPPADSSKPTITERTNAKVSMMSDIVLFSKDE